MTAATAQIPMMPAERVKPFADAVHQVLTKMVGVEASIGEARLKSRGDALYEVCGIIGFTGSVSGSVALGFSERAALALVERFCGRALALTDPDCADAIEELANMVAGCAKSKLKGDSSITVPSVVIGNGYAIASMRDTPCVVIPCVCPFGEFAVEICLKAA